MDDKGLRLKAVSFALSLDDSYMLLFCINLLKAGTSIEEYFYQWTWIHKEIIIVIGRRLFKWTQIIIDNSVYLTF